MHPDALCPQPDCGAANRERALHAPPPSLPDRLAEVLAQHRNVDVVGADDVGMFVVWECTCGETGAPRRVEPYTAVLGEARTHQAVQLADTVADWLHEQAAGIAAQISPTEQPAELRAMAEVLHAAAEQAREGVRGDGSSEPA